MPLVRERVDTAVQGLLQPRVTVELPVVQPLEQFVSACAAPAGSPAACHACLFHVDEVVCANPVYPRRCPAAGLTA